MLPDGPGQERAQQVLVDAAGGGVPAVDVGLSAVGEAAVVGGEVGEERGGVPQLAAGVDVAVGPDRGVLRGLAQVSQEVPGGVLPQRLTVLGVLDAGQPAGKPLLEQEQEPIDRWEDAAADGQVTDIDHRPPRGQGAQPVVGERNRAAG